VEGRTVFASDDSNAACGTDGSHSTDGSHGKGSSGNDGSGRRGNSHGGGDSTGTDGSYGALTLGMDRVGSHSRLEGPRELDSEDVGESTVLAMLSSKVESGGESA
jgi:hypothetical protein